MSRTTDALIKALDSPASLTPAERAFTGGSPSCCPAGTPCDCRACAPELHDDPDAYLAAGAEAAVGRAGRLERDLADARASLAAAEAQLASARDVLALAVGVMGRVGTRLAAAVESSQRGEAPDVLDLMACRTLLEAASLRAALAAGEKPPGAADAT